MTEMAIANVNTSVPEGPEAPRECNKTVTGLLYLAITIKRYCTYYYIVNHTSVLVLMHILQY